MAVLLRMGVDFGGDELLKATRNDGNTTTIAAGQLAALAVGFVYEPRQQPFALEGTVGAKLDAAHASNGDITFTRFPIELIASVAHQGARLGVGVTVHTEINLSCNVSNICSGSVDFDDAFGAIIQLAYNFRGHTARGGEIGARYTSIEYHATGARTGTPPIDGSSFGIFASARL